MARSCALWKRAGITTILIGIPILAGGLQANGDNRVLHFPADAYVGRLSIEDPCLGSEDFEGGRDLSLPFGLDPKRVCMAGDWDFVGLAQGDVPVPASRNVFLLVLLQPLPRNSSRLSRQARDFLQNRCRVEPKDLLGLSQLDPNDLYQLRISSLAGCPDVNRRVLEPISRLTGLEVLGLSGTGLTAEGMAHLKALRSLRALEITREFSIGNAGLAVLKDLPNLEYLDCETGTTDAGLKHLGQLRSLRYLRLRVGRIWGPGLAELSHLPRLERLCLWGETGLSDRHIAYLEGLTQLKSLTLWGTSEPLTDASLASIGRLEHLEELYFIHIATKFTDAGIAQLKSLVNLRRLNFGQAMVGDEGVRHLAALSRLESIEGGLHVTAAGMKTLGTMRRLKCLNVGLKEPLQGYQGRTGIPHLLGLTSLEELSLDGRAVTDEDLNHIESLTQLKRFRAWGQGITDRGMVSISKLKQLEYLSLSGGAVSKRGLNQLNSLTKLRNLGVRAFSEGDLDIDETPLNLSALTNLKTLGLQGLPLQDGDLASLAGKHDLEKLSLRGAFTEAGLRHLHDLPKLKNLDISGIACPTGKDLAYLKQLDGLGDLKLRGEIPDAALGHLPTMGGLWSFEAETGEPIRPETVAHLKERLPVLEYIYIREPRQLTRPPVRIRGSRTRPRTNRRRQ